jgi:predicted nucleic acid-binding protein
VLLEAYAVLTRLPALQRISPALVGEALASLDLPVLELPGSAHVDLVAKLAGGGLGGGATYDGLVAATALHHGLALVSADTRARPVYDLVGVSVESLA